MCVYVCVYVYMDVCQWFVFMPTGMPACLFVSLPAGL